MSDYGEEQMRKLARRLSAAVENRTLLWEEEGNHIYSSQFGSHKVFVSSVDRDGQEPYELAVIDDLGNVIDKMNTESSSTAGGQDVKELFQRVRRQIGRIDEVLDEIMDGLPPDPWDSMF